MPRYRTISCEYCGYMLLKRDSVCEMCGRMTRRGKARLVAKAVQVVVVLAGFAVIFAIIRRFVPH